MQGWFGLERLKDLVQDMLTYSKDRVPEYSLTNLNELIEPIMDLMKVRASEKKVNLSFNPDETIEDIVLDPKGIYRCVLNLVSNAIDACETEDASVTLTTKTSVSKFAVVQVEDQGTGMDEQTIQSIFQPFFSKKGSKGTGLDLL